MIFGLDDTPAATPFPSPELAEKEPDGLLAVGGDLTVTRLKLAYQQGIFPWFNADQPILWWSPDPRSVLFTDELHVSRSLRKCLRKGRFRLSCNLAFVKVMRGCAMTRADGTGTWLIPDMRKAYDALHQQGFAHSIEVWFDDELVGGLYGVALGTMFFGESMFSLATNASKVALVYLVESLAARGVALIDSQVETTHLRSMGARLIARADFLKFVERDIARPPLADWPPAPLNCNELLHAG